MNYYVNNWLGQMLFRGEFKDCLAFCQSRILAFQRVGMNIPAFEVYYCGATKPSAVFQNGELIVNAETTSTKKQ